MNLFKKDVELISDLRWLLVLEKVYMFNGIPINKVAQTEMKETLEVLSRAGIIIKTDTKYKIAEQALKIVTQSLEASGIR